MRVLPTCLQTACIWHLVLRVFVHICTRSDVASPCVGENEQIQINSYTPIDG